VVKTDGLHIKVLRDGYSEPQWFHKSFWDLGGVKSSNNKKKDKPGQ
jgi:hypothetical protein